MKKLTSITFILVLFFQVINSYGQENKYAIGVEAGPSRSYLYGNRMLKEFGEPAARFYIGISFQYNLNKVLSLRSGLAYEPKGHIEKLPAVDQNGVQIGTSTSELKSSYLTVPLLIRATFGHRIKYFINAGPYAGYAFKQIVNFTGPQGLDIEQDQSEYFKQTDFGISAGAGVAFPVSSDLDLSLEIRNNLGLLNISKGPVIENGSIKTNSLNILFGCSYKFGN